MKLYKEYKEVIKKVGKLEKAYFSTFNMDIEFVEKYILPPLLGEEVADSKLKLENLNNTLMKKNKPDIKFFYDANKLTSNDKSTLVDIYPIIHIGGVFHPKVIYLKGDKATYLFVGSGNLTINGWGRNIEAFKIVKIEDDNLHNQVLDFFDDVFKLGGLTEHKKKREINYNNDINFIHSFTQKDDSIFLQSLKMKKQIQIHSPYFSDLDILFEKKEFEHLEGIHIVPDLIENQKIRLKELPKDERVKFYRFKKKKFNEENESSTNHAKVWISDTKYAIGSYNCTEAALYGKNFEAALVSSYENRGGFEIDSDNYVEHTPETTKDAEKLEGDGEGESQERFTSLYHLKADYKTYAFELTKIAGSQEDKAIKILLPSLNDKITKKEMNSLDLETKSTIFRALFKNKIFEIWHKKKLIFRGFIEEINVTSENRHTDNTEILDDMFLSLQDAKNPTAGKALKDRSSDNVLEDEAIYKRKKQQNHINYFSMFTGFNNLNKRYDAIKDKPKELHHFCYTSFISLSKIKSMLEEKKEDNNLFIYLSIEELNKLIRRVNRKGAKMKELENIKIKLYAKDKEFIKACS